MVAKADARGLKLLFTFWETPCWASVAPEDLKQGCAGAWWERRVQRYGPANPADYGDALAFLVKRYGGRVAAWEVWNEPNHPDYFIADDQAKSYAEIVKAAYPAAKAADPNSTVIAGSLADADFGFTERLFGHGIKGKFDAYSVHPYSGDRSPLDPGDDRWIQNSFIRGVPRVRDTLLAHGEDKPLWLTEFGWSTCTVRGLQSYKNCVDASVQASYLKQAYGQMQQWSYVPVGVWFNLEDTSADLGDRVDNYGLHTVDGRQKPAATAFREVSEAFGGGMPVAYDRPATAPTKPKPGNSGSNGIKSVKKGAVDLTVTRRRGKVVARGACRRRHPPRASRLPLPRQAARLRAADELHARRARRPQRQVQRQAAPPAAPQGPLADRGSHHEGRARHARGAHHPLTRVSGERGSARSSRARRCPRRRAR